MQPLTHGRVSFLILAIALALPARAGTIIQSDLASIRGDQSRLLLGTGNDVTIAVVDGGVDVNHPTLIGSLYKAKDFSNSGTTDDDKADIGHGTGIAGILLGRNKASGYTGLAPQANLVNARVVNANNRQTNTWVGNGMFWALDQGAKVVNLSLGNPTNKPGREQLNLMVDYAAEHYGVTVVVAAGNENNSAVAYTPGGNFNGITVGATSGRHFNYVTGFSNYSLPGDARTKPELVAPGEGVTLATANWESGSKYFDQGWGTSFAAPMVGGITAQLIGYGQDHHLSTDPLVLKAVMMAGATKVFHNDGTTWTVRHVQKRKDGNVIDQPLDEEMGAGRVDGVGAYNIYARKTDSSTSYANWKLSSSKENQTTTIDLGSFTAGQHLDATMDWYRHVDRTPGGDNGVDGQDTYFGSASLADFSLTLLRDGVKVVTSDSDQDNFEHLSIDLNKPGDYSLQVFRYAGKGEEDEKYALAMRVLAAVGKGRHATASARLAKSSLAATTPIGALRGGELPVSTDLTSIPEPSALALFAIAATITMRHRKRG